MRGLILLVTLALVSQGYALNIEAFLKDLKAWKGFDQAILKLTVEEAGYMLGGIIASAGKTCEANPTKWMIRRKDSKGTTLLAVHLRQKLHGLPARDPLESGCKSHCFVLLGDEKGRNPLLGVRRATVD